MADPYYQDPNRRQALATPTGAGGQVPMGDSNYYWTPDRLAAIGWTGGSGIRVEPNSSIPSYIDQRNTPGNKIGQYTPEFQAFLTKNGLTPQLTPGQGGHTNSVLGPDGKPVAGTELYTPDTSIGTLGKVAIGGILAAAGAGAYAAQGVGAAGAGAGAGAGAAGGSGVISGGSGLTAAGSGVGGTGAGISATSGAGFGLAAPTGAGAGISAGGASLGGSLGSSLGAAGGVGSAVGAGGGSAATGSGSFLGNLGSKVATNGAGQLITAGIGQALTGSAPDAPDFNQVADAQTKANLQTALVNAQLNRVNETTPYGSVKYSQVPDPTSPTGFSYQRDTTLSPEQQALYQSSTKNAQGASNLAGQLQGQVGDALKNPFSLSDYGSSTKVSSPGDPMSAQGPNAVNLGNAASYAGGAQAVGKTLYDQRLALLQPQMDRQNAQLDTQLRNQGLMPGTQAYDNALSDLRTSQSQQLNQLAGDATTAAGNEQSRLAGLDLSLTGQNFNQQQTGFNNDLTKLQQSLTDRLSTAGFNNQTRSTDISQGIAARQTPLQEYNALQTGAQPTTPTFQPYGMAQTQAPNLQGAAQANYNAASDQYNAKVGNVNNWLNLGAKVFGS